MIHKKLFVGKGKTESIRDDNYDALDLQTGLWNGDIGLEAVEGRYFASRGSIVDVPLETRMGSTFGDDGVEKSGRSTRFITELWNCSLSSRVLVPTPISRSQAWNLC